MARDSREWTRSRFLRTQSLYASMAGSDGDAAADSSRRRWMEDRQQAEGEVEACDRARRRLGEAAAEEAGRRQLLLCYRGRSG